jgi:drug/metabolite transporter (DMT)-like permease
LQFKNTTLAGFLFLTAGNGCVVFALKYIDSGFAALLISSQPLILLIRLKILQKQNIKLRSIMGAFLGILGIVLLTYSQGIAGEISWIGVGLVMISLIYWGYGSIFLGTAVLPKNQFVNSAYQMITGGLMLLVLSKTTGENSTNLIELDVKAIGSMTFLIVFGSIIAFTSFNYLLQKVPPEKVATGTYLNTVVAVILGYLVLNEILAPIGILASAILLAGVYFINSAKS